jgi:hypothetical protein
VLHGGMIKPDRIREQEEEEPFFQLKGQISILRWEYNYLQI